MWSASSRCCLRAEDVVCMQEMSADTRFGLHAGDVCRQEILSACRRYCLLSVRRRCGLHAGDVWGQEMWSVCGRQGIYSQSYSLKFNRSHENHSEGKG